MVLIAALAPVGALAAAAPAPQYTVQDIQRSFGAGPAPAPAADDAPAATGDCAAQGMAVAADGSCEPRKKNARGFSLVAPGAPSSAAPVGGAAAPRSSAGVAAPPRTPVRRPAAAPAAAPSNHDLLITFANNSTMLTDQAKANAKVFAEAINGSALLSARFEIDGHTNAVGGRASNLELSRGRAQALVDYLVSLGVDASRFQVEGHGFDQPLPGTDAKSAANRRVEARRIG